MHYLFLIHPYFSFSEIDFSFGHRPRGGWCPLISIHMQDHAVHPSVCLYSSPCRTNGQTEGQNGLGYVWRWKGINSFRGRCPISAPLYSHIYCIRYRWPLTLSRLFLFYFFKKYDLRKRYNLLWVFISLLSPLNSQIFSLRWACLI